MSSSARSYLSTALDIMEKNSLRRHEIDWPRVRRTAFSVAGSAQKPEDTYGAIRVAINALGDKHSSFYEPQRVKGELEAPANTFDGLGGRSMEGRIGYISLPGVRSEAAFAEYARQGRAAMAEADRDRACGWVVDLRKEDGGGMGAPLAVVGPILGGGNVGMFIDPDGEKSMWTAEGGAPVAHPDAPVAVLTSGATASAGEAVAVAFRGRPDTRFFGQRTGGVPTGNHPHDLSDGAMLILTEVKEADRTGRIYDGPIPPDEEVPAGRDALEAAKSWLLAQRACR
ncbi:S41 family peptidase [Streptomyces morookaense]|uniref:Peptidase S41 n=1 Tax=Streptomyces morookaense TaxID=1970 RepID=A0A7Y7B4F9_STRMO|nr:S41 family peptidase [Streptomyces morookaense]NVK78416.1 peptidase S41 [Streptomyces morookaense]GHF49942.1 peptidase S41 [Streptomyces morookaense]